MDELKYFSARKWRKYFILKVISFRMLLFLAENSHKMSDLPRS